MLKVKVWGLFTFLIAPNAASSLTMAGTRSMNSCRAMPTFVPGLGVAVPRGYPHTCVDACHRPLKGCTQERGVPDKRDTALRVSFVWPGERLLPRSPFYLILSSFLFVPQFPIAAATCPIIPPRPPPAACRRPRRFAPIVSSNSIPCA